MIREATPLSERDRGIPYREIVRDVIEGRGFRDYLRYDHEGNLWINDVRVMDLVQYGTPLEITDTRIIELRCKQWVERTQKIAREVGYEGGFEYFYAAKANFKAPFTTTAYRMGWGAETTSTQDLINIEWLAEHGLFDKTTSKIICNGFFLDASKFGAPKENKTIKSKGILFETGTTVDYAGEMDYLARIVRLHEKGFRIVPIIYNLDELKKLIGKMTKIDIMLRLKFGKVDNDRDLARLPSRFGMSMEDFMKAAEIAEQPDNQLTLTGIHAMVGAAENIPVDTFVRSLLFAADKYFILRARHPNLKYFNIGGGVPPLSEQHDHDEFLQRLLVGIKEKARAANLPVPTVVFELGSYVASEAGFDVAKIVHHERNNVDANGTPQTWAVGDLSLVATIPDVWFLPGKRFTMLAANNANKPPKQTFLGDLTCDSGSVYPEQILIPDTVEDTYLVMLGTGAYQDALAGAGGIHHCGLYEDAKWIIVTRGGVTQAHLVGRQTAKDVQVDLQYTNKALAYLK